MILLENKNWMLLAGLSIFLAFSACSNPSSDPPAKSQGLTEDQLADLKKEYPTLRTEAAPAPEPSADASPANIPGSIREALSDGILETISGEATYYADVFEGRTTASGIPFRQNQMVAAHRTYPFGTLLRVTNERNGRTVQVRIVDRGPFGTTAQKRRTVLDLSSRAAERLDFIQAGRARVKVEVLEWGDGLPGA